jgi:2,4-dienoyl-CoA reductase (NADPH2)
VTPRDPAIPGAREQAGRMVLSYLEVLRGAPVGRRVAIVGAGGIGFDVAEFVLSDGHSTTLDPEAWMREWGVTDPAIARSGLTQPAVAPASRQVTLLQRKMGGFGRTLGKTTGWIHRSALKMKRVEMIGGVNYEAVDERGLHVSFGERHEKALLVEADTVILCAGQEPLRELAEPLQRAGARVHLIGGADVAAELDAKRAIEQGSRLAMGL